MKNIFYWRMSERHAEASFRMAERRRTKRFNTPRLAAEGAVEPKVRRHRVQGANLWFEPCGINTLYKLILLITISLLTACKSAPPQIVPEEPPPPEIPAEPEPEIEFLEPEFTITSIIILQAELINTRMKLNIKINNPNTYPVNLASFRYELFGDSNFWAGATEKDLAYVPPGGSAESSFDFSMNFIGMKRKLLDDIIAMRQVNYRITGEMKMETGIATHPVFTVKYDYSGNSPVVK